MEIKKTLRPTQETAGLSAKAVPKASASNKTTTPTQVPTKIPSKITSSNPKIKAKIKPTIKTNPIPTIKQKRTSFKVIPEKKEAYLQTDCAEKIKAEKEEDPTKRRTGGDK